MSESNAGELRGMILHIIDQETSDPTHPVRTDIIADRIVRLCTRPAPADALRERALRESAKEGIWEGLWKCEMCGKTGSPDWYEMVKGGSHYTNNGNCSGRLVHLERRALLAPHEEAPGSVVGHCEKCGEINITTVTQTGPNEGKHYNARTKEMCGPVRWERTIDEKLSSIQEAGKHSFPTAGLPGSEEAVDASS